MKEQKMFFNKEQIELLKEIERLENSCPSDDLKKISDGMPERVFVDERKTLTIIERMKIVEEIQSEYSMLKGRTQFFDTQLFAAMDEYLKRCTETGYRIEGL